MTVGFKYFVLLANMRTGSNLFEQNIRLYRGFSCHGELFNPHFIGFPGTNRLYNTTMTERELQPKKLLDEMVQQEKTTIPGFRLFADHDHRILEHCLQDQSCAKIILSRNPLDSFVSHAIAKATDQWKLTDISKRKKAKIEFDIVAFRSYLNRIQKFQSEIGAKLQRTGQAAFHLNFEDLKKVEVFNGLAQFLGSNEELKSLGETIVRQNPEELKDKVNNFQEMVNGVRSLDLLGTNNVPVLEAERNPGSKNFRAAGTLPLLILPMHRSEFPQVTRWLAKHQQRVSETSTIETEMTQRQLAHWLDKHPRRQSAAIISHPVERAYGAFYRYIFCTGEEAFPWIRTTLENHYKLSLPDKKLTKQPNRNVLENSGYGAAHHQKAFEKFLKFLKGNLQGQTRARVDQSWASQNAIMQGYAHLVIPDVVIRKESLALELMIIEKKLNLQPVPLPDIDDEAQCFSLAEIYSPKIERAARATYARDYQMFGFDNWSA